MPVRVRVQLLGGATITADEASEAEAEVAAAAAAVEAGAARLLEEEEEAGDMREGGGMMGPTHVWANG